MRDVAAVTVATCASFRRALVFFSNWVSQFFGFKVFFRYIVHLISQFYVSRLGLGFSSFNFPQNRNSAILAE